MGNACTREKNDADDASRRERRERVLRVTPKGGDSNTGEYDPRPRGVAGTDVPWSSSTRSTPVNRHPPTPTQYPYQQQPQQGYGGGLPLGRLGGSRPSSPVGGYDGSSGNRRSSPSRGRRLPSPANNGNQADVGYNPYYPSSNGGGGSRPRTPLGQLVPGVGHQQQPPLRQQPQQQLTTGPTGMPLMYASSGSVARRPPSTGRAGTPRSRTQSNGPPVRSSPAGGPPRSGGVSATRSRAGSSRKTVMELKPVVIQAIGLLAADELQQRQDILMWERDFRAEANERYWWLLQNSMSFGAITDLIAVEQRSRFAVQRQEDASYYALIKWLRELLQEAKLAQMVADTLRRQHVPSPHRRRLTNGRASEFSSQGASPIKRMSMAEEEMMMGNSSVELPTEQQGRWGRRSSLSANVSHNPPPYVPHDPLPIEYSSSRRPPTGSSSMVRARSDSIPTHASSYNTTHRLEEKMAPSLSASPQSRYADPHASNPYHHQGVAAGDAHMYGMRGEVVTSPMPASISQRNPSPLVFRGGASSQPVSQPVSQTHWSPPRVMAARSPVVATSHRPASPPQAAPPSQRRFSGVVVPTRHTERQMGLVEGQEVQERNHIEYMEQSRFASISAYLQCDEEAALMEKIARQQRMVESSKVAYKQNSLGRWGSVPPPSRRAPSIPAAHRPHQPGAHSPHQLSAHSRMSSDAKSASMLATQYRLASLNTMNRGV